jgi:hypothetical protein
LAFGLLTKQPFRGEKRHEQNIPQAARANRDYAAFRQDFTPATGPKNRGREQASAADFQTAAAAQELRRFHAAPTTA